MDTKNIVPVEWKDQRVLTSAQLAEAYECSVDNIKVNFNANKKHYKEGVHYFKIAGKELEELRVKNPYLQISPMTRVLYLWTYQGCVRHCKSINTLKAWAMFDELEKHYFNKFVVAPLATPLATPAPVVEALLDIYRVYLFLLSDGNVKIGCTKRFIPRAGEVERDTGLKIVDVYFTPEMSYKNAHLIEWCTKKKLAPKCIKGEIFAVEFYKAYATIVHYTKMTFAVLPTKSINLIADKQA